MFERYTEHARRVIFFARYEASEFGSPYIEPEHLLLGLFRERSSIHYLLPSSLSPEEVRQEFRATLVVGEKTSTSVDLPLSQACTRILSNAAEESERLEASHIGPEHLLLGMLREDTLAAAVLRRNGLQLERLREKLAQGGPIAAQRGGDQSAIFALRGKFSAFVRRLTPDIEPASVYRLQPQHEETE
jgi:ATP-dependent Clp protease ATP-binding subunit ClpC